MEHLPKIVRDRLQAMTTSDPHPDPNLLAAFTENALLDRERASVMEHLAHCEHCREIVAAPVLELEPALMAAAAAPMPHAVMSVKRWSVLRWTAIAACAIIVGSVALLVPFEKKKVAYTAASPAAPAKEKSEESNRVDEPVLLSKSAPVSDLETERDAGQARQAPSSRVRSSGAKMAAPTRALSAELAANDKSLQVATVPPAASAPPSKPPIVAEMAPGVSGNAVGGATESVTVDAKSGVEGTVEVSAAPVAKQQETITARNEVASTRTSTLATSADEISEARQKKDRVFFRAATMLQPRWTLSSEGALLRSTDDGQLWSAVPVPAAGPFRALSGKGQDVWIGGAKGTLLHSSDGGQHWAQVKPTSNGVSLTDDIAQIDFPVPQHGVVTTANRQIWTTSDSGRTWLKK